MDDDAGADEDQLSAPFSAHARGVPLTSPEASRAQLLSWYQLIAVPCASFCLQRTQVLGATSASRVRLPAS